MPSGQPHSASNPKVGQQNLNPRRPPGSAQARFLRPREGDRPFLRQIWNDWGYGSLEEQIWQSLMDNSNALRGAEKGMESEAVVQ